MTEERPRKYYHTTQPDQEEFEESQASNISKKPKEKTSESELYPILSDFLYKEYGIYSKRIDEKGSSNTKGKRANEWLHPDVVAIQDLTSGWHEKTKQCVEECSAKKAKLWSFEVKCKIDNSNVRKSFFQTVANSSWANYSYLVAEELDSKAASELRMLSALHGIGFIVLDKGSPPDSQILIPARERVNIDWDTANRLVDANADFKDFIEEVIDFYKTRKLPKRDVKKEWLDE